MTLRMELIAAYLARGAVVDLARAISAEVDGWFADLGMAEVACSTPYPRWWFVR